MRLCLYNWQYLDWVAIYWAESVLWLSHCPRLVSVIVLTDNTEIADIAIFPEAGPGTHHASALRRLSEGHDLPSQLLLELSNQISRKSLLSLDIYLKWYIFSYFTSWNIWRNFSSNWSPSCPPDLELTSIRNVTLGEDILLESLFSVQFNDFHSTPRYLLLFTSPSLDIKVFINPLAPLRKRWCGAPSWLPIRGSGVHYPSDCSRQPKTLSFSEKRGTKNKSCWLKCLIQITDTENVMMSSVTTA